MPQVIGKCTMYKEGKIIETQEKSISIYIGDIVEFIDGSYLSDSQPNRDLNGITEKFWEFAPSANYPTGTKKATVLEIGCKVAPTTRKHDSISVEMETPILVKCENGMKLYCNPMNINIL